MKSLVRFWVRGLVTWIFCFFGDCVEGGLESFKSWRG